MKFTIAGFALTNARVADGYVLVKVRENMKVKDGEVAYDFNLWVKNGLREYAATVNKGDFVFAMGEGTEEVSAYRNALRIERNVNFVHALKIVHKNHAPEDENHAPEDEDYAPEDENNEDVPF